MQLNEKIETVKEQLSEIVERIKPHTEKPLSFIDDNVLKASSPFNKYVRRAIDYIIQAAFLLVVTILFNTVLMYGFRMLWELYQATHVGQQFISSFPDKAYVLGEIARYQPFTFSLELSLSTFFVCFAIGAVCQLLHITRYFYDPQGFMGKLIIWGCLLTAANAYFLERRYQIEYWEMICVLALVPTLCVFRACFRFTRGLLPEVGDMVGFAQRQIR